jgi:hypothetical protein
MALLRGRSPIRSVQFLYLVVYVKGAIGKVVECDIVKMPQPLGYQWVRCSEVVCSDLIGRLPLDEAILDQRDRSKKTSDESGYLFPDWFRGIHPTCSSQVLERKTSQW